MRETHKLITEADLAEAMGVSFKSIPSYVAQSVLPKPDGARRQKGYWFKDTAKAWFDEIQKNQVAYAPINNLGLDELKRFGIYACLAKTSGPIGICRPSRLVLLYHGKTFVYEVIGIVTEDPVFAEK